MAVDSVTAAATGIQQQYVPARQPQDAERPRGNDEAARPREVKAPERPQQPAPAEQPKPVVNAQGQKTGTIINTTA